MTSDPLDNLWGKYQRQLERQRVEKALRKTAEQTLMQTLLMGGGRQPGPFERQIKKKVRRVKVQPFGPIKVRKNNGR